MKKRTLFKESFYATLFILLSLYGLSQIKFNSDIFNPIAKAFGDFRLTDIVFSHLRENPKHDDRIIMVNVGNQPRDTIAKMIEIIAADKPKVVGIDVFYRKRKAWKTDSTLAAAFSKLDHLVLVSELHENTDSLRIDSMSTSNPIFMKHAEPGFADMITEGKDVFKTSRDCIIQDIIPKPVYEKEVVRIMKDTMISGKMDQIEADSIIYNYKGLKDTMYYSFPLKLASIYAPESVDKLMARNLETEIINFQGNIDVRKEGVSSNSKIVFTSLDWFQVTNKEFEPGTFKDKIVVMGFMGDYIGEQTLTDIFFTPLNYEYIGKANPDMFGVVIHANIVAMVLKGDYIDVMPEYLNLIISIILIYFNVWFFAYLYFRTELWYDGLSLVITIAEILVLMIIVLMVFNDYNYKIDITLPAAALFLTGNLIEIHFGIVKPTLLKLKGKIKFFNKNKPIFTKN
jgi:CHASE2 domain-containing sensor protein